MVAVPTNQNGTQAPAPASTSAALVRHGSGAEPRNMEELKDFAVMAAASRFFGAETPEQALIIAMSGKDLGFTYTQALRAFHVIKGKASLSADGMVAVCLSRPDLCEYFRAVEVTETKAVWETKRAGSEPVRYSFSMDDAQRAGLASEMYKKHPKRMLSARAKSYLARDVYPELLMGLVTEDEAQEIAASRGPRQTDGFAPAPLAPRGDDAATAGALALQIAEAADEAALKRVGRAIVDAKIGDDERKELRKAYAIRSNHFKKAAKEARGGESAEAPAASATGGSVPDAEYDQREPGGDG